MHPRPTITGLIALIVIAIAQLQCNNNAVTAHNNVTLLNDKHNCNSIGIDTIADLAQASPEPSLACNRLKDDTDVSLPFKGHQHNVAAGNTTEERFRAALDQVEQLVARNHSFAPCFGTNGSLYTIPNNSLTDSKAKDLAARFAEARVQCEAFVREAEELTGSYMDLARLDVEGEEA